MLLNKVAMAVIMAATLNGCSQFQSSEKRKNLQVQNLLSKSILNAVILVSHMKKFELEKWPNRYST